MWLRSLAKEREIWRAGSGTADERRWTQMGLSEVGVLDE
jgi:hypothetical protein